MRWLEIIMERGEAYLYHTTPADYAAKIIYTNTIIGHTSHFGPKFGKTGDVHGVSLSRNWNFVRNFRGGQGVIFVLDWQKLKQSYSIKPIDYFSTKFRNSQRLDRQRTECEEFVFGSITNLDRYLIEIRIPKIIYEECLEDNEHWVDPEENSRYWVLTSHPKLKII